VAVEKEIWVGKVLYNGQVIREEGAKEQGEVLDKFLVPAVARSVGRLEIKGEGNDCRDCGKGLGEHGDEFLVVLLFRLQASNLGQAFQSDVAELGNFEEFTQRLQQADAARRSGEDVTKRDPVQEAQ